MSKLKRIALGVLLVAAFALVGTMDYEDEVVQDNHCLEMVEGGYWPAEVCQ